MFFENDDKKTLKYISTPNLLQSKILIHPSGQKVKFYCAFFLGSLVSASVASLFLVFNGNCDWKANSQRWKIYIKTDNRLLLVFPSLRRSPSDGMCGCFTHRAICLKGAYINFLCLSLFQNIFFMVPALSSYSTTATKHSALHKSELFSKFVSMEMRQMF